ncbi:hypothetical protein PHYPO_G00083660 [Pangasianodon hypophthalmus]|uniref:Uncharacterized protein n=1 Tax=Pangasianodon hypophthalmus TaxID=310915 RepID=A0A5N5LM26_PANHP|nr:hypothetical protein PHYPO_G00083660 [Pangasianodon hypophthalmus]
MALQWRLQRERERKREAESDWRREEVNEGEREEAVREKRKQSEQKIMGGGNEKDDLSVFSRIPPSSPGHLDWIRLGKNTLK